MFRMYILLFTCAKCILVIEYSEPFWSVMHRGKDKAAIPADIGNDKQLYPTLLKLYPIAMSLGNAVFNGENFKQAF